MHRLLAIFTFSLLIMACSTNFLNRGQNKFGPFEFVDKESAKKLLLQEDVFLRGLSQFDLSSRMQTEENIDHDQYMSHLAKQPRSWDHKEKENVIQLLKSVLEKIEPYNLNLPEPIQLIKSTGLEEGEAAYCRSNAIILPEKMVNMPSRSLERLLMHELFHVYSKNNIEIRNELYALIGFFPCPELEFPEELKDLKITNPDAPLLNSYIELNTETGNKLAVPILYAKAPYSKEKGGRFFEYLTFRLLEVNIDSLGTKAERINGELNLINPQENKSFLNFIGANTGYIIHPEEVMADNFTFLMFEDQDLKSPELTEKIKAVFKKHAVLNDN